MGRKSEGPVDIGSVGLWGEWHLSGTSQIDTGNPVPLPTLELRLAIIDAWKQAPVAFESCWDMRKWKEAGWDIRHIFDYALQLRNANNAEPNEISQR